MTETGPTISLWTASDGYPVQVATWSATSPTIGRVAILHGVQSHGGWYHGLAQTLAGLGYEAHFPDRRGSGANRVDRGDTPSAGRLVLDVTEYLADLRRSDPKLPQALAGISWGGKLAVIAAGRRPELVDGLALICPGLHPRVGVPRGKRIQIALAYLFRPRKTFSIPLSDPALFTDSQAGQEFIANDPLGLRAATARLLAASFLIDRMVDRMPRRIRQPALLMLAGEDRIIDNDRTRAYFARLASTDRQVLDYPEAHHTMEFDPDPTRYARDLAGWLDRKIVDEPR